MQFCRNLIRAVFTGKPDKIDPVAERKQALTVFLLEMGHPRRGLSAVCKRLRATRNLVEVVLDQVNEGAFEIFWQVVK